MADDAKRADAKLLKMTHCPKCDLAAGTMLQPFCQHRECPMRHLYRRPTGEETTPATPRAGDSE